MEKTVLIIDDVGFDRTLIGALLRQHGFKVIAEAANGKDGVSKALELQPDLITLDKRMPDMDGMQVLTELRAQNYTREIVIVSGDDIDSIQQQAEALGIKVFFKKPISREKLTTELPRLFQD